ncbi:protein-glutamine gamma-glutamyltransferase E-like isoform X2 [Eublepharis macularius]|uniref:protein-glutamine gamma-glutamyltransferase n=1 Tax=Eublepharis macularius TaxID=481883 RepID=A0AA97K5J7_EUBMA|nr:protein-glutamine gamma-glutamyltransferase E-like isoform X2 [Eublepharis macularius]
MTAETLANVDWKWDENTVAHHTDRYNTKELVVRRGQPFVLTLTFSRTKPLGNNLTLIAETDANPDLQAKTRMAFAVSNTLSSSSWSAVQTSTDARSVSVSISSPPNAIVGRYKLSMTTSSGSSRPDRSLGTVVLLFNPWLAEDDVFMPNDAEREEYVLSEFGLVFSGSADHISNFGWDYGQFQEDILNICLTMLDRSRSCKQDPQGDLARRNDPKHVSRVLSAMVNSNDDSGVLKGNWSGKYRGGQNPSSWTGSVDLLRKWKASEFRAVKFGQCWVFAGVLTTVLRCMGVPTRMISNFNSAHDEDRTLTVDEYYDPSGNYLTMGIDSIWNYHVWNESWFVRPDLGSAYDGWQILDATPQERSTGIFQCGPASVRAIKEGDVDLNYDSPFVFAEVNADRITWTYNPSTRESKRLYTETKSVGQFISTKAVGSHTRMDITNNYKYAEEKTLPIKISYEEYQQYLTTDNMIHTTALCQVEKEGDILVDRVITLENPSLTIKVLGRAKVNEEARVEVVFTNPLDQEVKDCVLLAEGSDLLVDKIKLDAPPVEAKRHTIIHFALTPRKYGTKQLLINFSCDRFQDIKAFQTVDVAK